MKGRKVGGSRQLNYQDRHRAEGLCMHCSRPVVELRRGKGGECAVHLLYFRLRMRRRTGAKKKYRTWLSDERLEEMVKEILEQERKEKERVG